MRTCGVRCKFIMVIKSETRGMEPQVHEASERKRGALEKDYGTVREMVGVFSLKMNTPTAVLPWYKIM